MSMWSPIQDDTEIKATYERLFAAGKPKKVALVAKGAGLASDRR
jgi:hypothetical protein